MSIDVKKVLKNSAISTDQLRSEQVKTHRDAATEYKTWVSKQDKMVAASAKVGVYTVVGC